jgi:glutaredoxin
MSRKVIIIVIIAIAILAGIVFFISRNNSSQGTDGASGNGMIFFYGQGCPHCANVEKFLEENKTVEENVKFDKLEVWGNEKNKELLAEKAKKCGLKLDSIGVPLFWDGSKCIEGDVDIINLLKEKAGIQ